MQRFFLPIKEKFQFSDIGFSRTGKTGQIVPNRFVGAILRDRKSTSKILSLSLGIHEANKTNHDPQELIRNLFTTQEIGEYVVRGIAGDKPGNQRGKHA
ncbi:MAG TPA: hypothetical protein ENJ91_02595 [Rhodobacteraceae bacterium]|nr:hypothetical protein [Paracoccaceae bacterium]